MVRQALMERDPDTGKVIGVKPFKETVRNARTPGEVEDALDRFVAGELRGGFFEESAVEG